MTAVSLAPYLPWTDRKGRVDPVRAAAFAALCAPALWMVWLWATAGFGPKPVTVAIHMSGDWAARFLVLTLAVTPLRLLARWNALVSIRRMAGLSVLFYAILHIVLYAFEQKWILWTIASEIALRVYLTIGFAALLGLVALGATSTDGAIRRMGAQAWGRLHLLVHPIAILILVHYFMQEKSDVTDPLLLAGLALLLWGYRLLRRWRLERHALALVALAAAAGLATAGVELLWYGLMTGVKVSRVWLANFDFDVAIRPPWIVLLVGLAVAAAARPLESLVSRGAPSRP